MDNTKTTESANEFDCLKKLWEVISARRRFEFALLIILMLIVSILEAVAISSVMPLVSSVVAPGKILSVSSSIMLLIKRFGAADLTNERILFLWLFVVTSAVSGATRLILLWSSNKISFGVGSEISTKIFANALGRPYEWHLNHNSSEIVSALTSKVSILLYNVISPVVVLISSLLFIFIVITSLLLLNSELSIKLFFWIGLIYGLIVFITRARLVKISSLVATETEILVKSVQEALGGIREVILDQRQCVLIKKYTQSDQRLRDAQSQIQFLSQFPRYSIETIGLIVVAVVAYSSMTRGDNIPEVTGAIAGLGLGIQRLLPIIQQGYQSWSFLTGAHKTVISLLDLAVVDTNVENEKSSQNIFFSEIIEFQNISFKYRDSDLPILNCVSYKIHRGTRLGIKGKTGSGKSTFINVLMGLLQPTSGCILVDGVSLRRENLGNWQRKIAHVPQTIFLVDGSIKNNIILDAPEEGDHYNSVKDVLVQAGLWEDIQKMPNGMYTLVGERGIRLSGGQRQRIGIARALYKKADIIILDEATSALDTTTESEVMECVYRLPGAITVIIIAHRLSTLNGCDKMVDISNGTITSCTNK